MAHSTDTYLVDADGKLRHHLCFGASPELIDRQVRDVDG
jgi:cytochrome oxidase Cu insertion factor (SCO1/SenC/PrrC family)